jgi:hypothetical protein
VHFQPESALPFLRQVSLAITKVLTMGTCSSQTEPTKHKGGVLGYNNGGESIRYIPALPSSEEAQVPREADQSSLFGSRPATYIIDRHGRATMNSTYFNNPLADEVTPLTNEELKFIVVPVLTLIRDKNISECIPDDILLRTVRGLMNKAPQTEKWKVEVLKGTHVHCAVVCETLERIISWRTRPDVQANDILKRSLQGADDFHRWWPVKITGCDSDGHVIVCERLKEIHADALLAKFSLTQILTHRVQVSVFYPFVKLDRQI